LTRVGVVMSGVTERCYPLAALTVDEVLAGVVLRGVAALVLAGALGLSPVLASTVVVPDDFPTVQLAIDSQADTVLIREGKYPERPVVEHPVVLRGIGTTRRPQLEGLSSNNSHFPLFTYPRLVSVSGIDFSGRIEHTTVTIRPRLLSFSFTECSLDAGFLQLLSTDPEEITLLTIRNCRMGGSSRARVEQVVMDADTVDGGVAWAVNEAWIGNSWFRGGVGRAIELTDWPRPGLTAHNRIENYGTGIFIQNGDFYRIEENTILDCGNGIQLVSGDVRVSNNVIQDCGVGIDITTGDANLLSNTILGATGPGVTSRWAGLDMRQNVIANCHGDGVVIDDPGPYWAWDRTVLVGNTIFSNGGSAIVVTRPFYPVSVQGNIGFANAGWGLIVEPGAVVSLGCNDWFGNAGAVSGVGADPTDVSLDPLFCGRDSADVRLDSGSPLLVVTGCGQIGALGVGCGETATLLQRFTAERVGGGIRVVWAVAEGGTASEVWLERSEGTRGEAWIRPSTELSTESRSVVELDRSALLDRAYRYRLVAREGNDDIVIGPPIAVEAQAPVEFRLVHVGPNPGGGSVRIAFALEHMAAIEVDVFDVQGRKVASPGRGVWPAGTHTVEWNGLTRGGEAAPPGLYLVRYAYPGGQDRMRIIRTR